LGEKPQTAELRWRRLGAGDYAKVPLSHVARGVYSITLSAEAVKDDFEYYVEAKVASRSLVFPPTAPAMAQTVVVSAE
jgi:hypothetical protein